MNKMTQPFHPAIMLVDDHLSVREAMAQLLEENEMNICAQAGSRDEALSFLNTKRPDLALVDILTDEEGLRLVVDLHRQGIPVVVCSSHQDSGYARRALDAGARAYVAKGDAARALVRILRDVLDGWVLISPRAAE